MIRVAIGRPLARGLERLSMAVGDCRDQDHITAGAEHWPCRPGWLVRLRAAIWDAGQAVSAWADLPEDAG